MNEKVIKLNESKIRSIVREVLENAINYEGMPHQKVIDFKEQSIEFENWLKSYLRENPDEILTMDSARKVLGPLHEMNMVLGELVQSILEA